MGFCVSLTLVLVFARLAGWIDWPWWAVASQLVLDAALRLALLARAAWKDAELRRGIDEAVRNSPKA